MKWIKIVVDIFDDEKILLIEALPEADSIIVIWFKLLCLAGKINNCGVLMMNERIAYTDEMLSQVFRRPVNTIRLALKTFERFGMIEIVNDTIFIPNWEKHQNIEGMQKIREQTRKRVAEYREREKQKLSVTQNVTLRNATDVDTDIDKDITTTTSSSKLSQDSKDTQNVTYTKTMDGMDRFTAQLEKPSTAAAYLMDMGIDLGDYFIAQQYNGFIDDGMEEDAIMYAAYLAKSINKVSWAYIKKILNNWITSGITTKSQAEEEERKHEKESEVNLNGIPGRNDRPKGGGNRKSAGAPNLKPRFVGHVYDADGNDITPGI